MSKIKVSFDPVKFIKKPEKNEVAGISNRIASNIIHLDDATSIRAFAEDVAGGHAFAPATFKNGIRKEEAFDQMQFLSLDFDSGVTFDEVAERAKKYDLPIFFAYETFSSVNKDKFRVSFLNNVPMDDVKLAKIAKHALMEIFPESDKSCKDMSRMYYGGKELLYYDDKIPTVDTELLLRNMTYYMKNRRGPKHYKTHIRKFANKHDIKLNEKGLLDIVPIDRPEENHVDLVESRPEKVGVSDDGKNGKKSPKSFIVYKNNINNIYNGNGEFFPNSPNFKKSYYQINLNDGYTENSGRNQTARNRNHREYRSYDLDNINSKCQLYREFSTGKAMCHEWLFGIATNLIQIEKGIAVFKDILSSYPEHYDATKLEKWDFHIKYINENDYRPQRCDNFCPYKNNCQHSSNILTTAKPKRRTIERVSGYEETYCTVNEAHDDLRQKLTEAINSKGDMWHVIKAQTAVGKTFAYLNLAKEFEALSMKFLIVVPTNILKHDVQGRADKLGIHIAVSPSLDEIEGVLSPHVWNHIRRLRNSGLHTKVYPYIDNLVKNGDETLIEYFKQLKEFKNFDGHAIITHRRFLNMGEKELNKYDVIIIDEDILLSSIATDQREIPISKLKEILRLATKKRNANVSADRSKCRAYNALVKKIGYIHKCTEQQNVIKAPVVEWDTDMDFDDFPPGLKEYTNEKNEEIEGISALTDIPSFCLAEYFLYRKALEEKDLEEDCISFLKPFKFKDIKCIMVSATANQRVCEYVFGADKVKFYECKKARLTGKLYQFYEHSMSRSYLADNLDVFDRIKKWSGPEFEHLITYKKYAKPAGTSLWFGNLAGIDYLKEQNLNVVGTQNYPEFVYKLLPIILGLDFDHDAKMKYIPIIRNGYQFHFMTFEDEILREFHLWMVESELEQAVGRARLLRFDCIVNLFSNYPLEQAIMMEVKLMLKRS